MRLCARSPRPECPLPGERRVKVTEANLPHFPRGRRTSRAVILSFTAAPGTAPGRTSWRAGSPPRPRKQTPPFQGNGGASNVGCGGLQPPRIGPTAGPDLTLKLLADKQLYLHLSYRVLSGTTLASGCQVQNAMQLRAAGFEQAYFTSACQSKADLSNRRPEVRF